MQYILTIQGRLESLNEYIDASRANRMKSAKMKREAQERIEYAILSQLPRIHISCPVRLSFVFHEKNKKRDLDNVSAFAHKVIQDALVSCRVIDNDGWANIVGYEDRFYIDSANPRIEVMISEAGI